MKNEIYYFVKNINLYLIWLTGSSMTGKNITNFSFNNFLANNLF